MWGLSKNTPFYTYLGLLVVAAFVVFKIPHLSLPYFWDEIGVFARGINHQYHHGVSLMPVSVPPLISRGHPLFFTFLYAGYAKLMGSNNVSVVHSLSLILSVVLLLSVYYCVSKQYNKAAAFFSTALLAAQPMFIAQAGMALPEMLLALLIWWGVYNYSVGNFFWAIVFSCLAALTKETGVLLPVAFAALTVFQLIAGVKKLKDISLAQAVSIIAAPVVFGIFLLVQKQQNGWYFFGYHIEAFKVDMAFILSNLGDFITFILYKQGRNQWIIIMALGFIAFLFSKGINRQTLTKGFMPLALIMLIGVMLFYSASFYMNRYLLCLFPLVSVIIGLSLSLLLQKWLPVALAIVIVLCGLSLSHLDDNYFAYDDNMAYVRTLTTTQQAMNKLANDLERGPVYSNFPVFYAITEGENGFENQEKLVPVWHPDSTDVKYLVIAEFGVPMEDTIKRKFTPAYSFKDGFATVNLLVKNKPTQ